MCIKINKIGKQEVGISWVQKTPPTIWGTYIKLVTKYQISAINSCWEKCDEKCVYMFNVYKNQLSQQTGSRNLTGPKTLPTLWYTYMTLVTKYQISAINSYWEICDEKYLGRTEGQTDRGKTVYPPPPSGSGGIKITVLALNNNHYRFVVEPDQQSCYILLSHNTYLILFDISENLQIKYDI